MGASSKDEQSRVRSLLLDTVSLLCKNGLTYKKMKIQGVIGITLDEDDVFIVHINDIVGEGAEAAKRAERSGSKDSTSSQRKRTSTSSPAGKGPPDKRTTKDGDVIVIVEDEKKKLQNQRPMISSVRGGLPPNHPHTPQKQINPGVGSPNRMSYVRVIGSPNQRGGMRMMSPRGRPPMHGMQALRCQFCGAAFSTHMAYVTHLHEAHGGAGLSPAQVPGPGGPPRPMGQPFPSGVTVRRNLYPNQPPLVVRKNRHDNNSDSPIAIDASPPPTESSTGQVSANAPTEQAQSATENTQNEDNPTEQNTEAAAASSDKNSEPSNSPENANEVGNPPSQGAESGSKSGSRPVSRSGSQADSRPASRASSNNQATRNDASDSSDTDPYSPSEAAPAASSPQEMPSLAPEASKPAHPVNTINITPGTSSTQNIIDQLASLGEQVGAEARAVEVSKPKSEPPSLSPQVNVRNPPTPSRGPNENPPTLTPSVTAATIQIKPEGPFGSEIFGGQQVFESQNHAVVTSISTQSGQFFPGSNMGPNGTTIMTVSQASPLLQRPPIVNPMNTNMPPPPQLQNMQNAPRRGPPPRGQYFGPGPGFNGYM